MKDGIKCCKCQGGRGAYNTPCYDNPKYCCKERKTKKAILKAKLNKKRYNDKKKTKKNSSWLFWK